MRETVRKASAESEDEERWRQRVIKRTKCKRKRRRGGKSERKGGTVSGEVLERSASYHLKVSHLAATDGMKAKLRKENT